MSRAHGWQEMPCNSWVGKFLRNSGQCLNVKRQVGVLLGSTGGGYCVWLFHIKQKHFVQQHSFLCSNIQHSTFPHQPKAGGPSSLSREGNVLHAFLLLAFAFLIFTREYSVSLLQSARIAPPRESNMGSCQPMSLGSYRPANLLIRTDSKQSLRPFPLESACRLTLQICP